MFRQPEKTETTPYQQGYNVGAQDAEMGISRGVVYIDCGDVRAFREGYAAAQKDHPRR